MRYLLGGLTCAAGVAAFVYGGYLAAIVTSSGDEPHYLQGFALVLAGLFAVALGARICGADIDWRGRD